MRKTKQTLIAFLQSACGFSTNDAEDIAYDLIGHGWVELDKPREFWICLECFKVYTEKVLNDGCYHMISELKCIKPNEVIHVREVISDE